MTKKVLILIVLLAFASNFYGQRGPMREKVKSLKIAYITARLDLTSTEAQAFWPIYNAHEEKQNELRKKERREIRAKLREANDLSEAEADKLLALALSIQAEKEKLNSNFLKEINKVISSKKTILLMNAEENFKKRLLREYRHKKGGGGHR